MKYNPFRPNSIIAPGMFHGRLPEIDAIEQALFQTKNANPSHFMILGERGIGKSSLFWMVKWIASGSIKATGGINFNFLVLSVDLGDAATQLDIIRAIGREAKAALGERDELRARAKAFWDWCANWEILGVRYHKEAASFDPNDAADELVGKLAGLCSDLGDAIDGIVILIDEADRPGEEAGLGALCKLVTERLTRKNCDRVLFGLAGLPPLIAKLRASHESSPRIFTTMVLDPLLTHERELVIDSGIRQANEKNEIQTTIEGAASKLLGGLSEGYPHFIQQFAYSAFDTDTDDIISPQDVVTGAFAENGALAQLGNKYFSEMYHSKIASDHYREVLHTMAEHSDQWVSRKIIIAESGLPSTTVNNALAALKTRGIILADESRKGRGFYRLPTRSFAAWINAIQSVEKESGISISASE
ncbi:UNVERIFIED_ORG: hypothetical protein J2W19_003187 [Shinella zoogloeoides]|nr:hypothetical protein [Shinella zoogloeoides]